MTAPAPTIGAEHDRQTAFRVRTDFRSPLNGDDGWAAATHVPATVLADQPFRLRLEVEAGAGAAPRRYGLQLRRNGGEWQAVAAELFPYPEKRFEAAFGEDVTVFETLFEIEQGTVVSLRPAQGGIVLDPGRQPLLAMARPPTHWRPSELSLEFRLPEREGAQLGVVFLERGTGDHAWLRLAAPDRVTLLTGTGSQTRRLAERRVPLSGGDWLALQIEVDERTVGVELDDTTIFETTRGPALRGEPRLGLRLAPDQAVELRSVAIEGEASSPRVSIVASPVFDHGTPTTDILPVSERAFTGGAGVSFAVQTPPWDARGGQGEWSFPLVVRRFADRAALNEAGDRFDFRLVRTDGTAVPAARAASVTLAVPDRHVGGTFVETPMRLGPWQADSGHLYFIMEPSETWNRMMVIRSEDGGRSWREADGGNRPRTGDLEGLGSRFVDGRIHVLHQTSDRVLYHAFDTGEAPGRAAGWVVRDEQVAAPPEPPTQVADLAVRADGSVLAFYGAGDGLEFRVRSTDGRWSAARALGESDGTVQSGVSVVGDGRGMVHVAWTAGDGSARYRRVHADLGLSDPVRFAEGLGTAEEEVGAILPLIDLPDSDQVLIVYRVADGRLFARCVDGQGRWSAPEPVTSRSVAQSPVDSDQVAADAVADGETVHLLFVDAGSGQLHYTARRAGAWTPAERITARAEVQWVRGNLVRRGDGTKAYGFIYDAGSGGGSGMNRYDELPLPRSASVAR